MDWLLLILGYEEQQTYILQSLGLHHTPAVGHADRSSNTSLALSMLEASCELMLCAEC